MCANDPHSFKNVRKCAATGVPPGATCMLLAKRIFVKNLYTNLKSLLKPLKVKVDSSK